MKGREGGRGRGKGEEGGGLGEGRERERKERRESEISNIKTLLLLANTNKMRAEYTLGRRGMNMKNVL